LGSLLNGGIIQGRGRPIVFYAFDLRRIYPAEGQCRGESFGRELWSIGA
jgi:hypothetical protein